MYLLSGEVQNFAQLFAVT